VLLLLLLATPTWAYRTDHGFLPEGTSQCAEHEPVTLSVPDNAAPVPDPVQGQFSGEFFHVEEIRGGLFYMTDGVYQSLFFVDDRGIIMVDAPPSIGVNSQAPQDSVSLLDIIYSVPATEGKPIVMLIYSHSHLDHIGAASQVKEAFPNVKIIAQEETKLQIARGSGTDGPFLPGISSVPPPLPNETFKTQRMVRVGHQNLVLSYEGPIHQPGNIFIYAPGHKTLMLVDVIFPGWSPFNDLALAKDVPRFVAAHEKILTFDFTTFVGGHLNRLGTRADVEESQRYTLDIKANAKAALSDPSLYAIFGIVPPDASVPLGLYNALGAFAIYLDQVACQCANRTLDAMLTPSGTHWRRRFGAADINTVGHCWNMAEALRIDSSF
jgi:glyoxylase-like metal-dependent hydrolase (beta-lactamase superfamily II)